MEIFKLKFKILQQEIARFLAMKSGKSFNALNLANALKVSPTAIAKSLNQLEKEGLIKIKKDKRFSIEFNRDNPRAIAFKRVENLRLIYESGLSEVLFEEFPGATIILFGSYSYGEDTISSDIDVAIIGSKEKEIKTDKFEKALGKKIILHFYPSFKEIHKNLKENILNGILLKGGVEL